MRGTPSGLLSHLSGELLTICHGWHVQRTDSRHYYFTDHATDLPISGIVYSAKTGFMPFTSKSTAGMNVDTIEITGGFDGDGVTDSDLRAGAWNGATGELFRVNYADTSLGVEKLSKFRLGEVRSGRQGFTVELRSLTAGLAQTIGQDIGPACATDVGSSACGVNLATFTDGRVSTTVTSVTSRRIFTCSGLTQSAGWFSFGRVEFDTVSGGSNKGLRSEIKLFSSGGVIELQQSLPYDVQVGDALIAQRGCNKQRDGDCLLVFDNVINFQGFPDLPGLDAMVNGL